MSQYNKDNNDQPQGFLNRVLPETDRHKSAQDIIAGDKISQHSGEALQARDQADLVTMTEAELSTIEGPSTVQESQLNAEVARAMEQIKNDAEILQHIQVDPTQAPLAFATETSILQFQGSVEQAVTVSGEAVLILAADATQFTGQVRAAETAIFTDQSVPEADRRASRAMVYPTEKLITAVQTGIKASGQRQVRKTVLHKAALAGHEAMDTVLRSLPEAASASLPAFPKPVKNKRKAKPGQGKVKAKGHGKARAPGSGKGGSGKGGGTPAGTPA